MAEIKETVAPKFRIESLSDLIFGLALSIGALTLIGQPPSDIQQLLLSIIYYAFSFFILIRVWYSYSRTMEELIIETKRALYLNISLLFLVSIEPFLFNQLITSNISAQYVSIIYAFDLGGLFAILALFAGSLLSNKDRPTHVLRHYSLSRIMLITGALLFFASTLPFFWTLVIPINNSTRIPSRFLIWMIPLLLPFIRRVLERKAEHQTLPVGNSST